MVPPGPPPPPAPGAFLALPAGVVACVTPVVLAAPGRVPTVADLAGWAIAAAMLASGVAYAAWTHGLPTAIRHTYNAHLAALAGMLLVGSMAQVPSLLVSGPAGQGLLAGLMGGGAAGIAAGLAGSLAHGRRASAIAGLAAGLAVACVFLASQGAGILALLLGVLGAYLVRWPPPGSSPTPSSDGRKALHASLAFLAMNILILVTFGQVAAAALVYGVGAMGGGPAPTGADISWLAPAGRWAAGLSGVVGALVAAWAWPRRSMAPVAAMVTLMAGCAWGAMRVEPTPGGIALAAAISIAGGAALSLWACPWPRRLRLAPAAVMAFAAFFLGSETLGTGPSWGFAGLIWVGAEIILLGALGVGVLFLAMRPVARGLDTGRTGGESGAPLAP